MKQTVEWWDRHQIALYLAAIALGAVVGLVAPSLSRPLELAINPVLGLLLFATFVGVPFAQFGRAFKDWRFITAVFVLNFVLVPLITFGLSRFVADDAALLVGVLFVLLTPCVDYVIVFSGLAGGAKDRLVAATPLLMVMQIALLPLLLWAMAGPDVVAAFDPRPFLEAFIILIVIPLGLAALTQWMARRSQFAVAVEAFMAGAMVPLMMLTLAVVVGSQVSHVAGALWSLLAVVPLFIAFVLGAAPAGALVARAFRLDTAARRAVVFSGVTRNALVVLPLALALPASFALTPLVVVTQTLVELVAIVVMVAVVPRFIRSPRSTSAGV